MKIFKFKKTPQTNTYAIYTLIAVALSLFIFIGFDIYINKQMAYFLVSILSFISIMSAIKKAGKELEEIIIKENEIKFYFQNKMKEPLIISKIKMTAVLLDDAIKFSDNETQKVIGQACKSNLENEADWEELIKCFQFKE